MSPLILLFIIIFENIKKFLRINIKNLFLNKMDISTRQVISQTLATTNAHVELDHLVDYEEKIADVSIEYKAYNDYDVEEIPIIDASVIEDLKEKADLMRLTHVNVPNSSSYFTDMFQYYVDNNLYPATNFFKGDGNGGTDDMIPIPDEFINNLDV